ncbi:C40 family peptidase [Streptomyces sp. NPDC007264]|uniref:C40 family peptidase n=1 Tax=Streptomyces sp. NPDC007264 TaxID=3364777 RepID=UPI0036DE2567
MAPEQTPRSDGPSRAEVRQRIHSLYDQAETATGNYNATRAMTAGTRGRVNPVPGGGRRGTDPTLDSVARQWFDVARSTLGPTVPAVLPADRMPGRPAARPASPADARPASPAKRPGGDLTGRELEAAGRPALELTGGTATGAAAAPRAELTARPLAALPAAAPERRPEAPKALPAPPAAPPAAARPSPVRTLKEQNQRKLFAAREVLAGHAAQRSTPLAAVEAPQAAWWPQPPAPVGTEPAGMSAGTGGPVAVAAPPAADAYAAGAYAGESVPRTDAFTDTGSLVGLAPLLDTASLTGAGPAIHPAPLTGTGSPIDTAPFSGTASPAGTAPLAGAAPLVGTQAFTDPGPFASGPFTSGPFTSGPFTSGPFTSGPAHPPATVGIPAPGYDTKAAKALAFARAQIGRPCVWGASGPESYDASGLVQAAWRAAGVTLPRSAQDQAAVGVAVPPTALQPGDLVFFQDDAGRAGHVGLCVGNGMMIHAPGPGAFIREEPVFHPGTPVVHGAVRPA